MLKIAISIGIVLGLMTALSVIVPDAFIQEIDDSIVYFLSAIWNLNALIDVSTIMSAILVLIDFYISIGVFWILYWIVKMVIG